MLTISVLIEDKACSDEFASEMGLSFLLEYGDAVILFDTGDSGKFLDNAERMGVDLSRVTHIVLSHGHFDHSGGLGKALTHIAAQKGGDNLPPLIAHPDVLLYRRRPLDHPRGPKDLDMPADGRKALESWPVTFSREPVYLREDIVFLGEIPHLRPDMCALVGEADQAGIMGKDMIPDDSALAFITEKGLIIVAGCSHSGILNIIEQAKAVTGVSTVRAVYGGLHCKDMDPPTIARAREALAALNLEKLCACHCTGDALDDFPGHIHMAAGERHVL